MEDVIGTEGAPFANMESFFRYTNKFMHTQLNKKPEICKLGIQNQEAIDILTF